MKKLIAMFFLLFITLPSFSESSFEKSGLAIYTGVGSRFGGFTSIGAKIEYQIKLKFDLLTISPSIAAGYILSPMNNYYGFTGDVVVEAGRKHRGCLGIAVGTIEEEYIKDKYLGDSKKYYSKNHLVWGPSLIVGYKGFSKSRFLWYISTGAGIAVNSINSGLDFEDGILKILASAGIGLKF